VRLSPLAFGLLAVVAFACGGGGKAPSITSAQLCGATKAPDVNVASSEVIEASGLAASRIDDDVLWLHNDSGDTARFYAIDTAGRHIGTFSLGSSVEAIDWEDMAAGPGPDGDSGYLYFADIGDNAAQREEVYVYRVEEPEVSTTTDTPTDNQVAEFDTFTLRYPDGAHDAEVFLVDPETNDFLIITKELSGDPSTVYRAPLPESAAPFTMEDVGEIDFRSMTSNVTPPADAPALVLGVPHLPTGGDISPNGDFIAIRTYGTVWIWPRPGDAPLWEAFNEPACEAPSELEVQGEAIAFDADGTGYFTVSEGQNPPLHHFTAE
jgi:hypothetical protein